MTQTVVDPGVLISALISPHGAPAEVYLRWRRGDFELIVSPLLLDELERVLQRPKFTRYVTADEAREYVETLRNEGVMRADVPDPVPVCRDPKDDYLVALARSANAGYLVSGDRDLLEMPVTGLLPPVPRVLRPREFVAALDLGLST